MVTWNRGLIDAFFYQNFQEVWYGAQPSDMPPIYHSERFSLLSHAQNKSCYEQERFHDYELALRLSVVESGRRKQVTHRKSPYSILFEEENVTFRIGTETVWTCTYFKFYKLFQFYVRLYCERFGDPCKKNLLQEVSKLQRQRLLRPVTQLRSRFKKCRHKRVKRLVSDQSYEYAKLNIKDRWLFSELTNALGHHPSVKYDMEKLKQLDCSDQILLCEDFLSLTELGDYSALLYAVNLKN